jgi:PKHD-type hydroxylase
MIWFESPDQLVGWDCKVPNALTQSEINLIEDYVDQFPEQLKKAEIKTANEPVDTDYRRSDIMFLYDTDVFSELYKKIFHIVFDANTAHFKYSLNHAEAFQYSVYNSVDLGCYDIHTDTQLRNTNGFNRKISFSILLNDVSEFEGGELLFHTSKHPYQAKLTKGDMILFPSFVPHSVSPVTKGTRKSLVGWMCGPNLV